MTEGPQSQHDGHLLLLAQLNKPPQIALAVPTEHAFLLLNVVPEYIGGYHRHAACLHLAYFLQPLVGRQSAVVYLAHDGAHPPSVYHQAMAVPGHSLAKVACPRLFLGVYLHIVGTGIGLVGHDAYIAECYVAGMAQEEALGRQVAPHGGFRIFALFLVLDGFGYRVQFLLGHAATMMDGDVRKPDVLYWVTWQSRNRAPHSTSIANVYVAQTNTIDASHRVDGYQSVKVVARLISSYFITSSPVAQAHKDGRLSTLDGEVRHVDILQHAAVDNLQRNGRRPYPLAEEFLTLVVAGLDNDARNADVAEAAVGLGTQLHGIAMARHDAVGYTHILAKPGRSRLQRDAVVVGVGYNTRHHHLMTAIQIEGVVVVVVTVQHLDTVNPQPVAGQVVLHPAAAVLQRDAAHRDILALNEAQQMGTGDALVIPRQLLEGTSTPVDNTLTADGHMVHLVGVNQLDGGSLCAQRHIVRLHRTVVLYARTSIERCAKFQIQMNVATQLDGANLIIA